MATPSMTLTSSPPILCRNSQSTELFQGRSAITEVEHSSSLFTSPSMRCATYLSSEPVEIAYSRRGVGVGGGGSHYVDPSLSMDAWNDSLHISASTSLKLRERGSPVSVFQGPGSGQSSGRLLSAREKAVTLSNSSETRSHLSLASDILRPLRRFEGFRTDLEEGPSPHPANPTKEQEYYPPSVETRLSDQDLARLKRPVGSSSLSKLLCEKPFSDTLPPCTRMVGNILKDAQARHRIFNDDLVVKAFHEAAKAHHGQLRANGDPYLVHCVETATILASVGANKVVVAAGLLHDTIDDAAMSYEELNCMFGAEVADLVKGVSRLSRLSQLARDNNTASRTEEADRMHTMFLAMTDVRVVLIKLADRLHNMRTLGALPTSKQQHIAEETLEIFAPLANRLGIWSWKAEIEDLCFKHLKPRDHQELAMKLAEGFRASTIMSAVHSLDQALQNNNIRYHDLCGRPKNLYSIYLKTVRKGRDLNQIYDLRGLRLILEREEDCFKALKVVHQLWPRVPGKLKDYITEPKTNGYRSLHTVVMGEDGLPLEVQIRSKEMHRQAEFGVAAHWRYKEGDTQLSASVLQMVEWVRWVLTWQNEIMDTKLRITSGSDLLLRPPCPFPLHKESCPHMHCTPPMSESDPVYVILLDGDKMTVQELPGGSTVADLLHSNGIPGEELWPAVNYKVVDDMRLRLEMGDLVDMNRSVSDESLREYREKIKRMFGHCEEPEGNAVLHSSWAKPSVALA